MVDLHSHTLASDGTFTPKELVKEAKKQGIKILSITDHDSISGLKEAKEAADKEGIIFINGIEFTTEYYGVEVHMLGYFFDIENKDLNDKINFLKNEREERARKMVLKLREFNFDITYEDILKEVTGEIVSRMHIALALLKKGFVYTKQEAFNNYIGTGKPAYVKSKILDPASAVRLIKNADGLVSLAHPKQINLNKKQLEELIDKLKLEGLDAIETYYWNFSEKEVEFYKKLAEKKNLILTGGSDFHGQNRSHVKIGDANVPYEVYENMLKRLSLKK